MDQLPQNSFNDSSHSLEPVQGERVIQAFRNAFDFTGEGGIDWSQRPYSKKWFWPRHGSRAMQHMLEELTMDGRILSFIHRSDREEVLAMQVKEAVVRVFTYLQPDTFLWVYPLTGRWIIEFSSDEYLHFDYCIPDEMNLVPVFGSCPFQ